MTQGKGKERARDTIPSTPPSLKAEKTWLDRVRQRMENALELTRYSQLMEQDNRGPLTFIYCTGIESDCGLEPSDNGCLCENCWDRLMQVSPSTRYDLAEVLAKEYSIRYGLVPTWWEIIQAIDS